MSHWNYRVLAEDAGGDVTLYWIGEVYYDDAGKPKNWSGREFNPISNWDEIEDLVGTVEQVAKAIHQPVLRVVGNKLVEQE